MKKTPKLPSPSVRRRPNATTAAAIAELEADGGKLHRGTGTDVLDAILHDRFDDIQPKTKQRR
jgi:hypothetical protein